MHILRKIATAIVFIVVSGTAMAQVSPPPGSGNAPIDGGILLLAAAGIGYGAYRKMNKR